MSDEKSTSQRFSHFYRSVLEKSLAEVKQLQKKSAPALHAIIDKTATTFSELEHYSEQEARLLTEYLKRDLRDAAEYMANEGKDFTDWLSLDLQLVEDKLLQMFMEAADHTTVDLLELKEMAEVAGYSSGDVAGPGSFRCDACGHVLQLVAIDEIPECPQCHKRHFHRATA